MSSSNVTAVSAFVEGAPPGELADVIAASDSDIKALTVDEPKILQSVGPTFEKYNEEQLTAVKLPGGSQNVLISSHNSLGDGKYYDVESQSSFNFDHATQKASSVQSYTHDTQHTDLIKSLLKSFSNHAHEHFPSSTYGVYSTNDGALAILLVANKYSPSNFWNGRWRSTYLYDPTTASLTGTIKVDVHYYEDGNVRLTTNKPLTLSIPSSSPSASEIVKQIAAAEKKYQEELNKGFAALSEGAFKGLRRQLPVTRQKVEWEKISSYRLGQDIGGGRSR
ncbi:F-actin-capping protein subunit alpha [Bachmanniomyces sp. S44760]|nr:F-actin-capping protein subunit alpha [Bachmanniomyces sp. S44760]